MRLVACSRCHAQYDVTDLDAARVRCACGEEVANLPSAARDADIRRCGSCGASLTAGADACAYCGSAVHRDPGRSLSLVCPECYARNPDTAAFCTHCGVEFRPQAPLLDDDGDALRCPCCDDAALLPRSIGGVSVRECPGCHGVWVPDGNFDALVEKVLARQRKLAEEGRTPPRRERATRFQRRVVYRRCPVCAGSMQRRNFARASGVIVDWCGRHGTWLDADELEDIALFILQGGLAGTAAGAPVGPGGGHRLPADPERVKALATAHRLMAEESMRRDKRHRWLRKVLGDDGESPAGSITDLLADLLG